MTCRWIVREGRGFPYWAYTTCKKGFNPLSKVKKKEHIREAYERRNCPICGKPIEIDLSLIEVGE